MAVVHDDRDDDEQDDEYVGGYYDEYDDDGNILDPLSPSSHVFIMVAVHDDRNDDEDNNEDDADICYHTNTKATLTSLTLYEYVVLITCLMH